MKRDFERGDYTAVDRSNDYCCCGSIHVETGAKIIAVIGFVFSALFFIAAIVGGVYHYAIAAGLVLLIYSFIFAAVKTRKAGYYLPFLILNGIGIVLNLLTLTYVVFVLIFMSREKEAELRKMHPDVEPHTLAFAALFVGLLNEAIPIWFQWVVYKAYNFMKREQ
ncbi:hypothetical protein AAVH_31586 [Aphelenchoides avenae]|nr:hypothetical protein AAVH_31586 [Aphelenchus avenae]